MTVQISNTLMMENAKYQIIRTSVPHVPFFDAAFLGLKPCYISTGAQKGFWGEYSVRENNFYLDNLYVHTEDDLYPPINGICATPPEESVLIAHNGRTYIQKSNHGHHLYKGLNIPLSLTMKFLVVKDRLTKPAHLVRCGSPSYWKYKYIKSIELRGGKVQAVIDETSTGRCVLDKIMTFAKGMNKNTLDKFDIINLAEKAEKEIDSPPWFICGKNGRE